MTAIRVGAGRQSLLTELPPDSENAASPAPATHKHLNVCSLDVRMMIRQKMQKPKKYFGVLHCHGLQEQMHSIYNDYITILFQPFNVGPV